VVDWQDIFLFFSQNVELPLPPMSGIQLLQLFEATCSPDLAIRANAEQQLKQAESSDAFLSTLLPL
jgi:hypothetical protein